MKFQANTVAANFTYNGIPVSISMIVNCLTHITQKTPGLYFLKSKFYTFFRYLNQFLFLRAYFPNAEHPGRIGKISVQNGRTVYIDNIPLF